MELRILPGNIANMIAAGEVVQRPASVVKELVENAVDAGAEQISVIIKDSGRTLIQVIDNGKGMNPDDAVLCFERHATSKIATAEDLEDITTFGFADVGARYIFTFLLFFLKSAVNLSELLPALFLLLIVVEGLIVESPMLLFSRKSKKAHNLSNYLK